MHNGAVHRTLAGAVEDVVELRVSTLLGKPMAPSRRPIVEGAWIGKQAAHSRVAQPAEGQGEIGTVAGHALQEVLCQGQIVRPRLEQAELAAARAYFGLAGTGPRYPPVTDMCRAIAGFCVRRSITKSCPFGLREMASSMAMMSAALSELVRIGVRRSAASSWPRHM